ncbi:helix-turn-helix domain-containing protein [Actinoplanes sp. NPDC051494]|uniref:helix-turn-helix domain-containing protein n=1 Tax=Actinoplanes sp. NPDC051494 TaxID=3363907 RepID=UPI0037B94E07
MTGRSFDEVMRGYPADDAGVHRVADAARVHFEAAYERDFGLGERIAGRREELGLTQEQVAERSGVRQSDISRIERGRANPTRATLEKIAAALGAQLTLVPMGAVPIETATMDADPDGQLKSGRTQK